MMIRSIVSLIFGYSRSEAVPELRIVRFSTPQEREEFRATQHLQRKGRFGRWVTLDVEDVPSHVLISLGAFGDTGGWKSKWADSHPDLLGRKVA